MFFAIFASGISLAFIMVSGADRRYDATTDTLAEAWKQANPFHNFPVVPNPVPMYHFVPALKQVPMYNFGPYKGQ